MFMPDNWVSSVRDVWKDQTLESRVWKKSARLAELLSGRDDTVRTYVRGGVLGIYICAVCIRIERKRLQNKEGQSCV